MSEDRSRSTDRRDRHRERRAARWPDHWPGGPDPAGTGFEAGPPWRSRRVRGSGFFLPLLVAAIQLIGTSAASDHNGLPGLGYALLLLGPAALLLRRSQPLLTYALALTATGLYLSLALPHGPFFLAGIVALFGAAQRVRREWLWLLTAAGFAGYVAVTVACGSIGGIAVTQPGSGAYLVTAIVAAVAVTLAEAARIRAEHFREMSRVAAVRAQARQEQSRRQASDERLRIARELHDVLGHHLSLINVRAGVALHLLDSRPAEVREALDAIKLASAEALREVRSVLATLNPVDEEAPRAPTHGLSDLDRLADETRAAGLPVTVTREGPARPVPAEVDRAAYRIVQEALTNVRRHAGDTATASVTVRYTPDTLILRVEDTGTGAVESTMDGSGNGIPGMRERATALGGTLAAGAGPEGGFRVAATLPTTTASTTATVAP